jgi:hypothetical protein
MTGSQAGCQAGRARSRKPERQSGDRNPLGRIVVYSEMCHSQTGNGLVGDHSREVGLWNVIECFPINALLGPSDRQTGKCRRLRLERRATAHEPKTGRVESDQRLKNPRSHPDFSGWKSVNFSVHAGRLKNISFPPASWVSPYPRFPLQRRFTYHAVKLTSSTHCCIVVPVAPMSIWNCTPMFSCQPRGSGALAYAWLKL